MGVWKGEYGAYAYAPGVGLRMVSDLYCYGKIKTKRVGGENKDFASENTVLSILFCIHNLKYAEKCQFALLLFFSLQYFCLL